MDTIIAGNSFLADWFSQHCHDVVIVPTAIDTDRYAPVNRPIQDSFVIVWTGIKVNLRYLYRIETALARFLRDHPNARLRIVSDSPPQFAQIDNDRVEFVSWTIQQEVTSLQTCDVGIMPLTDGVKERGKCSFKMLQYMAVGLPVVVSPVGLNSEILAKGNIGFPATNEQEWYEGLETLYQQRDMGKRQGVEGRRIAETEFSVVVIAEKLGNVFKDRLL
jgi:glycosyltransferase involved in cell wall biosynthesis